MSTLVPKTACRRALDRRIVEIEYRDPLLTRVRRRGVSAVCAMAPRHKKCRYNQYHQEDSFHDQSPCTEVSFFMPHAAQNMRPDRCSLGATVCGAIS